MKRAWTWLSDHKWLVAICIIAATSFSSWRADEAQDARERREDIQEQIDLAVHDTGEECRNANNSRELIRDMGVQLNVAAVSASTEALILVASTLEDPPSAETIDAYRIASQDQATSRANAIVATLEDRDCPAEERQARREAERALG